MPDAKTTRVPVKPLPPAEYLRECLDYDQETCALVWKERPQHHFMTAHAWRRWNTQFAGTVAGWIGDKKGYRRVTIDHCAYKAHRLIWKWMTGEDPPATPDHKDRNPDNNRWSNLRPATQPQQNYNAIKRNASGYRGVQRHARRWRAIINIGGVNTILGSFATAEEASAVYESVAREVHGEFYRKPAPAGSAG
jgi:hypothetical protein